MLRSHASKMSMEIPLLLVLSPVCAWGWGFCLYHGIPPVSLSAALLIFCGVLVGGRVDLLGAWGTQTRAYSVGERAWNYQGPTSQTPLNASHGPIFVSWGPACSRWPEATGYPNPDLDWPASWPHRSNLALLFQTVLAGKGLSRKVNWLFRSTAYKFRLCGLGVSAANGQGNILGSTKIGSTQTDPSSQKIQAGGETRLLSGHSESEDHACSSRFSWGPQTSSSLRASWMYKCCNGFLPAFPGTGILHLVSAKRIKTKAGQNS